MTRREIQDALAKLPGQIEEAEVALLEVRLSRDRHEEQLHDAEAALILGGTIDGKNSETRAAQLRQAMAGYRESLEGLERKCELARIKLHRLQAEFAAAKVAARLLAGDPE